MKAAPSSYVPLLALVAIYLLLGFFLFSYEHYPIDDDWSYIKAAETFHHTGKMQFTPWTAMSLVFQIWWGTCFTKLFGFSIGILRLSTLVMSLTGLIFFYLLLRELDHDWQTGFLAVLLVLFNPFSFPLNFTFFTDQFFISLLLVSTYFYYRACSEGKDVYLLIASLTASCSVLVRQNGILLPLSVVVYLVLRERSLHVVVRRSLLTLLAPLTTFLGFSYWLQAVHGSPAAYLQQVDTMLATIRNPFLLAVGVVWRPVLILEFLGFCLLPLSLSLLPRATELFKRRNYFLLLLFCLAGTLFYLIFDHIGLYPTSVYLWLNGFRFAYISEYGYRDVFNIFFFLYRIIDFLSLASIVYLIYLLFKYRSVLVRKCSFASPPLLIVLIGMFQFLFLLVTLYKFSRYYLLLIPFAIFIVLEITRRANIRKTVFIPLLGVYALFSLAVTQDFMSWNQVKWRAAQQLLDSGISPRSISAGFAWDAWHSSRYSLDNPHEIAPQRGDIPWWIEKLVPAVDPQYLIANSPVPSGFETFIYFDTDRYDIVDTYAYDSLFYPRALKVYVLKRAAHALKHTGETVKTFDFIHNLKGATIDSTPGSGVLKELSVEMDAVTKSAWLQTAPSRVSFRLHLPYGRCRLKGSVGMIPSCWDKGGDGVLYKITIHDIFLENFFRLPASAGVGQMKHFLRPRTFFTPPRTYFIHFIDPKNNPAERRWQDITLDLSAFAGKVVDVTFEVSGGPLSDNHCDEALWGEPVIESY